MREQSGRAFGNTCVNTDVKPACACPLPRRIARWVVVIALALIAAYLIDTWRAGVVDDRVPWRTDASAAATEARETGKPMLVFYTAGWCGPCQRLKADAFSDPALAEQITERFVPLKLDHDRLTPAQAAEARARGVTGLPTLLVRSADGPSHARLVGYHDRSFVRDWLAQAAGSPTTAAR